GGCGAEVAGVDAGAVVEVWESVGRRLAISSSYENQPGACPPGGHTCKPNPKRERFAAIWHNTGRPHPCPVSGGGHSVRARDSQLGACEPMTFSQLEDFACNGMATALRGLRKRPPMPTTQPKRAGIGSEAATARPTAGQDTAADPGATRRRRRFWW